MSGRKNISSWWQRRSDAEKSLLVVTGVAAAGVIIYSMWPDDASGGTSTDLDINENNLTYPKNQYKVFADAIEGFVWGIGGIVSWTEDDDAIGGTLMLMNNNDDVYQLIKAYDKRFVGVFIKDGGNLVETIAEYLDDDVKEEVNENYADRGISFIWL